MQHLPSLERYFQSLIRIIVFLQQFLTLLMLLPYMRRTECLFVDKFLALYNRMSYYSITSVPGLGKFK